MHHLIQYPTQYSKVVTICTDSGVDGPLAGIDVAIEIQWLPPETRSNIVGCRNFPLAVDLGTGSNLTNSADNWRMPRNSLLF